MNDVVMHSPELANYTRHLLGQIITKIYSASRIDPVIQYDDDFFFLTIQHAGDRNQLVTLIENCRQNLLNKITPAFPGGEVEVRTTTNDHYLIQITFKV